MQSKGVMCNIVGRLLNGCRSAGRTLFYRDQNLKTLKGRIEFNVKNNYYRRRFFWRHQGGLEFAPSSGR